MSKRFCLILAGILAAVLLLCSCTMMVYVPPADPVETETPQEETTETETSEDRTDSADPDMITLENIAALNGCAVEELNTVFDEEGNLTFIGNRIADMTITGVEEAADCVRRMSDLLAKEDLALKYHTTYTSPKTGITYYSFDQTAKGEAAGIKDQAVEFFCNTLKLAVDPDGYPVAVSAYLNHEVGKDSTINVITAQQAVDTVLAEYPDAHVYPENTILTYWDDKTSEAVSQGAKLSLVWIVYADDGAAEEAEVQEEQTGYELPLEDPETIDCAEYTAFVVSAKDTGEGTGSILAMLSTPNMTDYRTATANTDEAFFDNFEDAGTYTYTVDFNWMNESDREYSINYVGTDSMTVTVPVMRNLKDGLYYLGEKEHHIYMSNYYDFYRISEGDVRKFNPYVTENPENLESWHFQTGASPITGQTYFDDPDYVIASFAQYVKTIYSFGEKFNLFEMYPHDTYLLTTYTLSGTEYPEDATLFCNNAANLGQVYDWMVFETSPTLALCLDAKVMAHEYTHGVNMHFSNALYMNEQGAMMESYADVIGYLVAVLDDPELDDWNIGGTFGHVVRNLREPENFFRPKYKYGIYYENPIDQVMMQDLCIDFGGVHVNSGVPNYLGYSMMEGQIQNSTEAVLTKEETLFLWYETLFLGNYNTDFEDQCAYFQFAADALGLSREQKNFITRLAGELGMEDGNVSEELLNSENSKTIRATLKYEDDSTAENYKMGVIFQQLDENRNALATIRMGGFAGGTTQELRIRKDGNYNTLYLSCCTEDGRVFRGKGSLGGQEPELELRVMYREADAEEGFRIGKGETVTNLKGSYVWSVRPDEATGETVITSEQPWDCLVITKPEGASDGVYNVYILSMELTEAAEEAEAA